jgi:hypothetical protein
LHKHRSRYFTFHFFKQKLKLKSIYMLCGSCSSSHTENNKIGFAIFGFFCELIWSLQVTGRINKTGKNLIALSPLGILSLHKYALAFNAQAPGKNSPSQLYPPAAEQARRRRGRARGRKQARGMIDLTHKGLIRGGSSGGERSGDDRRRSSDGAAAAARIPGKCWRG